MNPPRTIAYAAAMVKPSGAALDALAVSSSRAARHPAF